jgi:hypothetical protein
MLILELLSLDESDDAYLKFELFKFNLKFLFLKFNSLLEDFRTFTSK